MAALDCCHLYLLLMRDFLDLRNTRLVRLTPAVKSMGSPTLLLSAECPCLTTMQASIFMQSVLSAIPCCIVCPLRRHHGSSLGSKVDLEGD